MNRTRTSASFFLWFISFSITDSNFNVQSHEISLSACLYKTHKNLEKKLALTRTTVHINVCRQRSMHERPLFRLLNRPFV